MKRITICTLLLMMIVTCYSQINNLKPPITKEDYLQKSTKQKKAAWIMLGGGATLFLTGIIIPKGDLVHEGWLDNEYENDGIKGAFQLTGVLSMIGSIPFFTASKKNNKRALSVSFKNEKAPLIQKSSFVYKVVPSLNLKISL